MSASGGFTSQLRELTGAPARVTGAWPAGLDGTLYRNAPTAYDWPQGAFGHWFDGHGQVHALQMTAGQVRHSCRFVETEALAYARRAGRPVGNFGTPAPGGLWGVALGRIMSTASTHVVAMGDQLFALQEGGRPWALTPELATIGPAGAPFAPLGDQYAAHPRQDPESGHWLAASLQYGGPRSQTRCVVTTHDARGRAQGRFELAMPYRPTIVHDFALTATRLAVPVFPQVTDPWRVALGGTMAYDSAWRPELGAWLLVSDRDGANRRRVELPPMFAFHVANAFDAPEGLVVDLVAYGTGEAVKGTGRLLTTGPDATMNASLRRVTIGAQGRVALTELAEGPLEFPAIDPRLTGRPHRYVYAVASTSNAPGTVAEAYGKLVRLDATGGESGAWSAPEGHVVGEPVPVPMAPDAPEAAVWLLSLIYDPLAHRSRLAVFDGRALASGPVAEAHLEVHVPLGFHGSFVPEVARGA